MIKRVDILNNKIRVLHYGALSGTYGGVESYIINQYRKLRKCNIQYDFLVNNSEEKLAYEDELKNYGCNIYRIWNGRKNGIIKHYYNLYKFFKSHKNLYDIAIGNYLDIQNIDFLIMAKLSGIKICIAHSHMADGKRCFRDKILVGINRILGWGFFDYLFACSERAGKWMFGSFLWRIKKKQVIYNSIEAKRYIFDKEKRKYVRSLLNLDNKFVIGHTGRFAIQKNHDFIIDVFKEINKQYNNSILVLVGKGPLEETIRNKVKSLNLEDNVIFFGERNDVNDLLQAMDIFIFPSNFEGLGISVIEAQYSGLKCFVSDNIPKEAKITENIFFISLEKNAKYWANFILNNKDYERKEMNDLVKNKEYDIDYNVDKIKEFFYGL